MVFGDIRARESEIKSKLDELKAENENLKEKLRLKELERIRLKKSFDLMNKSTDSNASEQPPCKEISIGLSKTVKSATAHSRLKNQNCSKQSAASLLTATTTANENTSNEQDDEDDEIYVILDDN
jgi:hypothetical protein